MAVKAKSEITLSRIIDISSVTRYYRLQSSTASTPSKPTTNPPGGNWSTTEPTYTSGSTNTLYLVDCTVYTNGTFSYSDVSKSSSYEAAKAAYNKAVNAENAADDASKIATNYMKTMIFDGKEGLVIGDLTGNTIGKNVLIDNDSVDIRNGETVLARYGDNKIELGINSPLASVTMCDGLINISNYYDNMDEYEDDELGIIIPAVHYHRGKIAAKDSLNVVSDHELIMEIDDIDEDGENMGYCQFRMVSGSPWNERVGRTYASWAIEGYRNGFKDQPFSSYIEMFDDRIKLSHQGGEYYTSAGVNIGRGGVYIWANSEVTINDHNVMLSDLKNSYNGLVHPDGTDANWLRVTQNGLIPYVSGGNSSSLGTSSWPFKNIYGIALYENGTALSSKYASQCYVAGEKFSYSGYLTGGYVTSSGTALRFSVSLPRPIAAGRGVSISGVTVRVRQAGKYVFGSSSSSNVAPSSVSASILGDRGTIAIFATMSNSTNASNNDAAGIEANFTLTIT